MLIDVHLVLIPLMLFLAAIFAASEASLFSLNRSQLEAMKEDRPGTYRRIRALIYQPDALLSTLIIGNECLNIMIGTFMVAFVEFNFPLLDERVAALISVLTSSFLLLTVSEILPKVLAFRLPAMMASVLVYPTSWAHFMLTPFRKVFLFISGEILKLFGIQAAPPSVVSEKDFLTLVEVGAESGSLDRDEKEMIQNVFHFSDVTVSAIMSPWNRVFWLRESLEIDEVLDEVRKHTYSRIPVIREREDRVVGVLYTKELLKLLLSPTLTPEADAVREAIFPPYIVSTHKKISKLFREFKLKKVHFALVVDEYGRHLGVVTLEDVLNALFQTGKRPDGGKG